MHTGGSLVRPHRKVLLLLPEYPASLWRVRLAVAGFAVYSAETVDAALALLWENRDCQTVVTASEFQSAIPALRGERPIKVLVIGGTVKQSIAFAADASEVDGPELTARVVQRLRHLTARKRGPKKVNTYSGYLAKKREQSVRTVAARRAERMVVAA